MRNKNSPGALMGADAFAHTRAAFDLPSGVIYLDGNSLGPLPHAVKARVNDVVDNEWGRSLIRGWNDDGWIDLPRKVGDKIGRLIGAPEGSVIAGDSTSINVLKALWAALRLRPDRKVILSDSGNFPTDLYVAQGLAASLGQGHELRIVAPDAVEDAIDANVAVVMLTEVDYRTGRRHDMVRLTEQAHAAGALAIWDLAHSAGAFPVDITAAGADFGVGCGYKYLNGGPGAPGFIYVMPDHQQQPPSLAGWMGHAAPFAFETAYRPADGIDRMLVGTPAVLGLSALDAALGLWGDVSLADVRARSIELSERFIAEVERRCRGRGLRLASPRDALRRGSQVSFHCAGGYAVMRALIAEGVIGDFRAPDIIRFGITPLYVGIDDIIQAAATLERVLRDELWQDPRHQVEMKVT